MTEETDQPPDFVRGVEELSAARFRPEVIVEELPAPPRVASYSYAITADVVVEDNELATGRLVLLHEPEGHDAWRGAFRCVTYVRAQIESEMLDDGTLDDGMMADVAWSWLTEALEAESALYDALSGTVTRVASQGFGGLADDPIRAELEIRASWTPAAGGMDRHAQGWGRLLCTVGGLPPVPSGIAPLTGRKER